MRSPGPLTKQAIACDEQITADLSLKCKLGRTKNPALIHDIGPVLCALSRCGKSFPMEPEKKTKRKGPGCQPGQASMPQPHGGAIGIAPHVVTDENRDKVLQYARVMNQDMIAAALDLSVDTLQRHYRKELDAGRREAVAAVGAKLLSRALAGHPACMIYYLKTQGKWTQRIEHVGADGKPIEFIDLSRLSDEELDLYGRLAAKVAGIDPDDATEFDSISEGES